MPFDSNSRARLEKTAARAMETFRRVREERSVRLERTDSRSGQFEVKGTRVGNAGVTRTLTKAEPLESVPTSAKTFRIQDRPKKD